MTDTDTATTPMLRFRLAGAWHPVLWNELSSSELIAEFVTSVVGTRDIDATVRARMRRDLAEAIATAKEGHAQAMFIATEIRPGLPMPVTLTIYSPPDLRMSPALGTAPDEVIDVLQKSFAESGQPHHETARRLSIDGSEILRLHHVDHQMLPEQPEAHAVTLTADYWYTVPASKQVMVATFSTPLGDIANIMLSFFDGLVAASSWDAAAA